MLVLRFFYASLLTAVLGSAHLVEDDDDFRPCGADPEEHHLENARQMALEEEAWRASGQPDAQAQITVDTVFHVVSISDKPSEGYLTDKQLKDQLHQINRQYHPHGIHFNLINTTRTIRKEWAQDNDKKKKWRKLRQGGYDTLNVYFQHRLTFRELGICHFPEDVEPNSDHFWRDGCVVKWNTVPGGSAKEAHQGKTLVHEIGHWFNLFHTFQGGCTNPGDHIADTPQQAEADWRCQVGYDSCPDSPGKDPVQNFMGYSSDHCRTEFTPDQRVRMHSAWKKFRKGH